MGAENTQTQQEEPLGDREKQAVMHSALVLRLATHQRCCLEPLANQRRSSEA